MTLISASQAANMLGVSRATFKQLSDLYEFLRIKIGRAIKFPKRDLLDKVDYVATNYQEFLPLDDLL
ncbi:helix-turn-helix domain-containing protein [Weissella paramesenteroides]|uniref:helix-turn-helix domain-containing protein n=1 Tax=Weissella paramesenteroides TaxID=1249 RepID=UPI001238D530|nr:helix-turn-helix domain-containing protein [Weissella paramesenteroides]KAA8440012.1 helix-turn-helix domain-containing protein [Weissella paramesenteroides]KAA8441143.1 helix-turn-helix domain-containing protein [Weissella paramesenteroides]KAA8443081.1 helix-turn-helix domain-containing protein [Weissella paramesenteroides]KAA8445443.1 helix-turn-helix domain-containing protein [Weissella paramesenteroides]KAA8448989.1 helix-turn-helix domain-containing protein [Weissella paramesenteroide